LNRILITHGHLDHILGLGGLLSTFSRWETLEHLEIWAGAWALERIKDLIFGVVLRGTRPSIQIDMIPIKPGTLIEDGYFRLSAFPVSHRGPDCFGFLFEETPRRPFLPERAEQLDIPPGPLRKDLVNGKSVTLPDGRTIEPDEVLGPPRRGTRLVHVGDCGKINNLIEVCDQVDALVIEATYLEYENKMAKKFGHLTAAQAASLAKRAGVGHLYLTHISRRYREKDIADEASKVFPNVTVARDFDTYSIRKATREGNETDHFDTDALV
jgi:ribonuclease Z